MATQYPRRRGDRGARARCFGADAVFRALERGDGTRRNFLDRRHEAEVFRLFRQSDVGVIGTRSCSYCCERALVSSRAPRRTELRSASDPGPRSFVLRRGASAWVRIAGIARTGASAFHVEAQAQPRLLLTCASGSSPRRRQIARGRGGPFRFVADAITPRCRRDFEAASCWPRAVVTRSERGRGFALAVHARAARNPCSERRPPRGQGFGAVGGLLPTRGRMPSPSFLKLAGQRE